MSFAVSFSTSCVGTARASLAGRGSGARQLAKGRVSAPRPAKHSLTTVAACDLQDNDACECDDYVPLALAKCYELVTGGGFNERYVIEPVTAGSLESLLNGAKTTYEEVTGVTLEQALQKENNILPVSFHKAEFCDDFDFRAKAATRTWLRPHPQENLMDIVPIGETRGEWNFDESHKRVLNFVNEVKDSDNVKQDMSIDVYNRESEEDEEIKKAYEA